MSPRVLVRSIALRLVPPGTAVQLASLRVAVAVAILLLPEVRDGPAMSALSPALRVAPEGLGWFVRVIPIGPAIATVMQAACVASALCALVGLAARRALTVLGLSAFYLFALGQLSGAVWHDMHLLWMTALLAASPCDDALAFDRRGAPRPPDSIRYGVPLFFARLLLACVYFFPGVHKLASSGLAWALSDNLRNQLWWKWAEYGRVPEFRIDRFPTVLHLGGLGVMGFELSFPFFALTRAGRPWAAALGLAFHAVAQAVFQIPFAALWMLYVVFVDPERAAAAFRRLVGRSRTLPQPAPAFDGATPAPPWPAAIVGAVLFTGAFVQGIRGQTRAFPFACYPTFQRMAGTAMPDLILEVEMHDGSRALVSHARDARGVRSQRQWGEIWSLAGATSPVDVERLHAYLDSVRRREPARSALRGASRATFYRGTLSVVPEDAGQPARRGALLAEFRLAPSPALSGEGDAPGE